MTIEKDDQKRADVVYDFEVKLSDKFFKKIDYFSNHYELEIGGFLVGELKDKVFFVEDILFPQQDVSSAEVEFNLRGGAFRKEYGEQINKIIGEWHSHNTMGSFWSSTDEHEFIDVFMENHDIGLFIVSSKNDHLVRVDIKKPVYFSINKLDYSVEEVEDDPIVKEIKEQIKKLREKLSEKEKEVEIDMKKVLEDKVKEKTYASVYSGSNYPDYQNWDYWGYGRNYSDFSQEELDEIDSMVEEYERKQEPKYISGGDYDEKRNEAINDIFYQSFSQDKKNFSFDLKNLETSWLDEIMESFGNDFEAEQDSVSGRWNLHFDFKNKEDFRKMKNEIKGLVKILIDEELINRIKEYDTIQG